MKWFLYVPVFWPHQWLSGFGSAILPTAWRNPAPGFFAGTVIFNQVSWPWINQGAMSNLDLCRGWLPKLHIISVKLFKLFISTDQWVPIAYHPDGYAQIFAGAAWMLDALSHWATTTRSTEREGWHAFGRREPTIKGTRDLAIFLVGHRQLRLPVKRRHEVSKKRIPVLMQTTKNMADQIRRAGVASFDLAGLADCLFGHEQVHSEAFPC